MAFTGLIQLVMWYQGQEMAFYVAYLRIIEDDLLNLVMEFSLCNSDSEIKELVGDDKEAIYVIGWLQILRFFVFFTLRYFG